MRRDPRAVGRQAGSHPSPAVPGEHDLQLGSHRRAVRSSPSARYLDRALDAARERPGPVRLRARGGRRRPRANARAARPRERRHGRLARQRGGIGQDARLLLERRRVRRQARLPLGRLLPAQDRRRWDPHRHADGQGAAAQRRARAPARGVCGTHRLRSGDEGSRRTGPVRARMASSTWSTEPPGARSAVRPCTESRPRSRSLRTCSPCSRNAAPRTGSSGSRRPQGRGSAASSSLAAPCRRSQ